MSLFCAQVVPVNSISFIWNDNMREKCEANANVTWRAWFVIDRAVMAYKGTETDVLYGVAIGPRGDGV